MSDSIEPSTKPKPFVFVVMPFSKEFDDVYQLGIKPACTEAGAYCERLDEQVFDDGMLDRIYNQIAKADIIVADMSCQNPNVFYEVGYAHALGKRVILMTREASDIPFDLKHRFHIVYEKSITNLKEKLKARVEWYVRNPEGSSIQSIDHLKVYVAGIEQPNDAACLLRHRRSYDIGGYSVRCLMLEVALYNDFSSTMEPAMARVGLITNHPFFSSSHDEGDLPFLETIQLPNGRFLHQQREATIIEPGAWQRFVFPLKPPLDHRYKDEEHVAKLIVQASGPPREITMKLRAPNISETWDRQ